MAGIARELADDVVVTNEKGEPVPNTSPPIYSAAELAAIKREADR
jgi:hypothetical protein